MTISESLALAFPSTIWVLLAVCLALCSIGFYKFVYFMSVGYGFAVCGVGIAIAFIYGKSLTIWSFLMCALLVAYGIRLGGFLLWRELKSAAYRKTLNEATGEGKPIPAFVKAAIWICVSLMYILQTAPLLYRAVNGDTGDVSVMLGVVIMAVAIAIESISDKQKSAAKAQNPKRFCDSGLFKIVRCPNYFGELLFWTGVFVSGIGAFVGVFQWLVAIIGFLLINYVMFSGAKRLEIRQNKNYGNDPEYQAYVAKTPIILPLVPLYHLEEFDFIVV